MASSVTLWPDFVPPIPGASFTAVAPTVVVSSPLLAPAVSVTAMAKVVVTDAPGVTWCAAGIIEHQGFNGGRDGRVIASDAVDTGDRVVAAGANVRQRAVGTIGQGDRYRLGLAYVQVGDRYGGERCQRRLVRHRLAGFVPPIAGGSFTAVALTVVEALLVLAPAVSDVAMVKVVVTVAPGVT